MAQLNAALAGRYAVEREIGAGGMATVYLAHDLKHDRKVAVKVLNPELGAVLGVERFLAEIKVTANLQHPNLLPLFDSGEAEGLLFYVMPYVEGESLRARLEREKQLPVDEAVRIASAIASALHYAHRHHVIHRDLKPENILLHEGQPLVADFGIALAVSKAGGQRITQTGLSLGTPQYMSPEQATGDRQVDGRTDIYSLATVLYEMLAGDPPHLASTAQAIISKVLTERPADLQVARAAVPDHVAFTIERALEKLPADRWPTAEAFADALTRPETAGAYAATRVHARHLHRRWFTDWRPWAGVAVAAAGWTMARSVLPPDLAVKRSVVRMTLDLPPDQRFLGGFALSHDGTRLAYTARSSDDRDSTARVYVRELDQLAGVPLPGTEGARGPFFSPDGAWIAFRVGDRIRKVSLRGGSAVTIADSVRTLTHAVDWGEDGRIVFLQSDSVIAQVDGAGGKPEVLFTAPDPLLTPIALPGGKWILASRCPHEGCWRADETELIAVNRQSGAARSVSGVKGVTEVRYLNGGKLIVRRSDGTVAGAAFDARGATLRSELVPLQEGVTSFDLSNAGDLATLSMTDREGEFVIIERGGTTRPLGGPHRNYVGTVVSPDSRRIAAEVEGPGRLVVFDIASATLTELTSSGHIGGEDWSPDGTRLTYSLYRDGTIALEWIAPDGDRTPHQFGEATPIMCCGGYGFLSPTWLPDGRRVAYSIDRKLGTERDILVRPVEGDVAPTVAVQTPADDVEPRVSPDGKWLAYRSGQPGSQDVFVQRFPESTGRIVVSTGGAGKYLWAHSSPTLFYRAADGWVYAARLDLGANPRVQRRERVLDVHGYTDWALFPDDRRFVVVRPTSSSRRQSLVLTLNWSGELRRLLSPRDANSGTSTRGG